MRITITEYYEANWGFFTALTLVMLSTLVAIGLAGYDIHCFNPTKPCKHMKHHTQSDRR